MGTLIKEVQQMLVNFFFSISYVEYHVPNSYERFVCVNLVNFTNVRTQKVPTT